MAIRDACLVGDFHGLKGLVICSDSKQVISLASSDLVPPWEIKTIIGDVHLLAKLHGFQLSLVPKVLNWIAIVAFINVFPYNWVSAPPAKFKSLVDGLVLYIFVFFIFKTKIGSINPRLDFQDYLLGIFFK